MAAVVSIRRDEGSLFRFGTKLLCVLNVTEPVMDRLVPYLDPRDASDPFLPASTGQRVEAREKAVVPGSRSEPASQPIAFFILLSCPFRDGNADFRDQWSVVCRPTPPKPPSSRGKQYEDTKYDQVWIDGSRNMGFVTRRSGPVGGSRDERRHIEERRPECKAKKGCHSERNAGFPGRAPKKPGGDAGHSRQEEHIHRNVIAGVGEAERIEHVGRVPICKKGAHRTANQNEGQYRFTGQTFFS